MYTVFKIQFDLGYVGAVLSLSVRSANTRLDLSSLMVYFTLISTAKHCQ